jgi:MinD superfamily P-loop ATPase
MRSRPPFGVKVKISIASGKGGTGKTTVAVGLALAAKSAVLIDCDVEAPNCHIFLREESPKISDVFVPVPRVNESKCTFCGTCARVCVFNALAIAGRKIILFEKLCHGCGACVVACPAGAVEEINRKIGVVELDSNGELLVITGRLDVGEALAVPVIKAAKRLAPQNGLTFIDCAPGTSCTMVEAVKGSDLCILVTEPTPFGLHDLQMAVDTLEELRIPAVVVVNRSDGRNENLKEFCSARGLQIVAELPLDRRAAEAYSKGKHPLLELNDWKHIFDELLNTVIQTLQDKFG